MKTSIYFLLLLTIYSCQKPATDNGNGPTPAPTFKPDTLSTGWTKIVIDSTESNYDVFFLNNNLGYTTGVKTYKTIDGGASWNLVNTTGFVNLFVTSNGNIFATRGTDSIYKSTNEGVSFTSTYMLDQAFYDVFALDNNNILTFGLNGVYTSTNGGALWNKINPSPGSSNICISYSTLFFRDLNTGWAADGKYVHRKISTGLGWSTYALDTAIACHFITDIYAPSNNIVFVADINGLLYKSTDAGQTFSIIKDFGTSGYNMDVHFIDNNLGYVSAGTKIFKTTDGGTSWTTVVSMGSALFNEIYFTDANHGWACGSKGVILKLN